MYKMAYLIIGVDGDVVTRLTLAVQRSAQAQYAADVINLEVLLRLLRQLVANQAVDTYTATSTSAQWYEYMYYGHTYLRVNYRS